MPTMEIDLSFDATIARRFWAKVMKYGPDECWIWTGNANAQGYGAIGARVEPSGVMKQCKAHRVSYALAHGPFDAKLCVMHSCDNPKCVNPAHLSLGTHKDNIQDMIAKGRNAEAVALSSLRMLGTSPSRTTRQKMREAKLGAKHWRAKPVTINGVSYPCLRDAGRALGVTEACVRQWVKKGKAVVQVGISAEATPESCQVAA